MDTVPLLSPTMESELLKEQWVFPQPKTNIIKEEEKAASSTWEENFQDLSGWCIDTFQGQCGFHIGESPTAKLSGTKYEGSSILSSEKGGLIDLPNVEAEEKWSTRMNSVKLNEHLNNNCPNSLQSMSDVTNKCQKEHHTTLQSNTSNSWVKLTKGTTPATNTTSWSRQNNSNVSMPLQFKYQGEDANMDDAYKTSVESTENQRDSWDLLYSVANNGSDTFDLLSYLCDDEMHSPEDSVSTDSSVLSKPSWSSTKVQTIIPQTQTKVKTEIRPTAQENVRSRAASTRASSSTATPNTSQKPEKPRTSVSNRVEKISHNKVVKRGRQSRRRHTDTDSEDRTNALHYRESREKNNEASRKSRMNKKAKENEMTMKAIELEKDNRILKMKVEELEKLVTSMRSALLKSALKKES
ncbi:uncharacterized protein LOC143188779 [Calliopsis andreniformis]|uniref:uncharacterized protein LOC143188779 n=1 Tax=Calliopsis andreniformis TaxID=337506 RepID=UPI003FCE8033